MFFIIIYWPSRIWLGILLDANLVVRSRLESSLVDFDSTSSRTFYFYLSNYMIFSLTSVLHEDRIVLFVSTVVCVEF